MRQYFFILFILPLSTYAQVKFKHISVNDGLSQSSIRAFDQGNAGYLWIATRDGLNQYDGSHFQIYRHTAGDTSSIADNAIWAITKSSQGGVWAATFAGISFFDPIREIFFNYAPPNLNGDFPLSYSMDIMEDHLLISTNDGLWEFNTITYAWKQYDEFKGKSIYFAVHLDAQKVLVGTNSGLIIKEGSNFTPIHTDSIRNCKAIYLTENEILVATETEVFLLDKDLSVAKSITFTERPIYFKQGISRDHEGRIWISGNNIFIINAEMTDVQELRHNRLEETSLSTSYTTDVFTTHDGTVWVGTNGFGIDKYNQSLSSIITLSFNPYNENALSDAYISGIYTKNGMLYAGSKDAIDIFDYKVYPPKKINQINYASLRTGLINKMLTLPNGNLLLATEKGLVEKAKQTIVRIEGYRLVDIEFLSDGRVLCATANGNQGLIVYNPKDFSYEKLQLLPKNEPLRSIFIEDSSIWVGADKGVFKISPRLDTYQTYNKNGAAYPSQVMCIFRDSKGILWVGSWGYGLFQLDEASNAFKPFALNSELPNQTIYGILEDGDQNLWMSSNNGIFCYKRDEEQIIRFSVDQGLQSNEFNTGSYIKANDSTMFFGGINGLSYFKPRDLLSISSSSQLFISNIWSNQRRINKSEWLNTELVLDDDQDFIWIEYTSIAFNSSSEIQYRYKMLNQDFYVYNGTNNYINLTNLSPGKYTILINSTDAYGRWKEDETSFSFTKRAPIWQRTWFIAMMIGILVAAGIFYNHIRIRLFQKKNEKLEKAVRERTLLISDQNNEILAQNEELLTQGNQLADQNAQLELQRKELLDLKISLEKRVEERTSDLHQRNEELKEQNQQMEQFSYITSHNLKGPIASLKGLLSLLPEKDEIKSNLIIDKIRQSISKLDSIIIDLASIMEMRKNQENFKVFSVLSVLEQVVDDLKDESILTKVNIMVIEPPKDIYIKGVRAYLYSIFYNLIQNGIKYRNAQKNQSYVHINTSVQDDIITIEVSDNGIGIDMKYAEPKLFRLFQRFNNTHEGKGVGLYMSKIQVESMNGSIMLKSEKGRGTTVRISFPIYSRVESL